MGNKNLKLFVWTGVLTDWTPGIIFTLAETVEEARKVIERDKKDWQNICEIYEKQPQVVEPKGFLLDGGS
jgi:hypothetical protein